MKLPLLYVFIIVNILFSCSSQTPSVIDPSHNKTNYEHTTRIHFGACQAGLTLDEREFQLMNALGVKWIRNSFAWHKVEKAPGQWDFSYYDRLMELAAQYDIKVLIILAYDTGWIYEEGETHRNITPDKLPDFLNYVKHIAMRYGDQAAGFEIWNEPNTPMFWKSRDDDFFELTQRSIATLKNHAPEVPVAVGSIFYHPIMSGKRYLKKIISVGLLDEADAVALHPYALSLSKAASRVAWADNLLQDYAYQKEIWITEIGFTTSGWYPNKTSVEGQAYKVIESMSRLSAAGAELVCWFKLLDGQMPNQIEKGTSSEEFFGLAYPDFTVKPSGISYRLLAKNLNGSSYNPRLSIHGMGSGSRPRMNAYRFDQADGTVITILWSEKEPAKLHIHGYKNSFTAINLITGIHRRHKTEDTIEIKNQPVLIKGPIANAKDRIELSIKDVQ
jgi:hypothetical protein